jgi:hypothetical protein
MTAINGVVAFVLVTMLLSWVPQYRGMVACSIPSISSAAPRGFSSFHGAVALAMAGQAGRAAIRVVLALIIAAVGSRACRALGADLLLAFRIFARNLDERRSGPWICRRSGNWSSSCCSS